MSQKSILSFFKQADKPLKVEPNKCESANESSAIGDSPVKKTRKRKIKQITESEEDSNGSYSESSKSIKDENERIESNQVSGANSKVSIEVTVQSKVTINSESTSSKSNGTPRKRKKGSELDSFGTECVKKEKLDKSEENSNNIEDKVNGINNASIENLPSTSTAEEQKQMVLKRKTARKSIKVGKITRKKDLCEKLSSDSIESSEETLRPENSAFVEDNKSDTGKSAGTLDETPKLNNVESINKSEGLQEDKSENVKAEDKSEKVKEEDKRGNFKKEGKNRNVKNESKIEKGPKEEDSEAEKEDKTKKVETIQNSTKSIHPFFDKQKKNVELPEENSTKSSVKKTSPTSPGVVYDPSKNKYHPIDDACWKHGEKVPYLALAKTLDLIENTSARLKIVEILSNFFRSVIVLTPEDLLQSLYLCLNRIAPEYEGIELGIGDMLLMKAVAQTTGRTLEKIRAEVKEKGDLGLVAESSRGNQKIMFAPPKLTVASVFSKFKEIARMSGNAVMAKKTDKIQVLLVACQNCEAKFIIRSLSGKLRIGLAEQSVLAALARAAVMTPPGQTYPPGNIDKSSGMSSENFKKLLDSKSLILKTTYSECPNFDLVIPVLLKEGIDGLPKHCQLSPGCPLKPMLAHPTTGIDEVLQRFDNNEFTCEFKYDGERAQIHRNEKGEVKIFSRNQEDNTSKYPDVIARIPKMLKDSTQSFIIDTEAVAWDSETQTILPFQVLSTRKKKDAVESEITVQVCVMAFDLLYLNGESLVKKTLKERRELLHSSFIEIPNKFMFVTYKDGNNAEIMQEFLDESVKGNCEGLMVKALEVDASYEIAKRSHNWLKLKKDYLNGVGDTLDLLVIGGYFGKGKRTGNYGGFLLACYDDENEEFQSICKLGTGFKDSELESHTKFLKEHVIESPKSYYRCDHSLEPDEWFEAVQVWEIKCADLSISPIHKAAAGIVDPEKGISLRFPRFIKIRDDKKTEDATSSAQVAEMYQRQEQVKSMKNKARPEEDYY